MHANGYGLKGIYSLDEYYAKDLSAYYSALAIGSHNYYLGRQKADITSWLLYFCKGMIDSFKKVRQQADRAKTRGEQDQATWLTQFDARQRRVIALCQSKKIITTKDVEQLLKLKPRTTRALIQKWVSTGFLKIEDPSKKSRSYILTIELP